MGTIFYIMGKSSTGKDSIYKKLLEKESLHLHKIVLYTTRPIRENEKNGVQYYFVTDEVAVQMEEEGRVIEMRAYHTVHGIWKYFTADCKTIDLGQFNYLVLGTLESYEKIRNYYGQGKVIPVYIEVEDGIRLSRALLREKQQEEPKYEEMCRRFLADQQDFSEEEIQKHQITQRFQNNGTLEECVEKIETYLLEMMKV